MPKLYFYGEVEIMLKMVTKKETGSTTNSFKSDSNSLQSDLSLLKIEDIIDIDLLQKFQDNFEVDQYK